MAYVSLYRKYRPQTFHDIVGQDHVTGTLINAIQTGQVHHAMLFCGTRGTGKTSTARVLAKALNCVKGPTPEPCNVCDACVSITDGTNLDVTEIDAASHGSVDDARDLREKASYAPAAARYKVYIIDEAHMVTTQGFNAMLKVLEEPPEHVRFVFCTTEPHKVIEAIRSRCQRHDFRRIRTAALVQDFARICEAEGVDIEPAALELVARAADGSHRDGLSRLDQVLTFAGPKVTLADVAQVLGALPVELRFDLAEALAAHRVADVLACVERVVVAGHDLHQFTREALEHLRDLYVLRVAPTSTTLVDVTPETRERLAAQAERFGPGELGRMVSIVGELYLDLRTATDQRLVVEVGLARAAVPEASLDAESLLARIERLERRLSIAGGEGTAPAAAPTGSAAAEPPAKKTAAAAPGTADRPEGTAARPADAPEPQPPVDGAPTGRVARRGKGRERLSTAPAAAGQAPPAAAQAPAEEAGWGPAEAPAQVPVDLDLVRRSWPLVLERVQAASRVTASFLGHGRPVALEGRQLVVELPRDRRFEAEALAGRSRQVDGVLEAMLGGGLEVRVVVGEHTGPEEPDPPPADAPAPAADQVVEFEVDPANDEGRPLDADADARAVADWAAKELGGKVIEERPNDSAARGGARGARKGR
ncbi:MAG TPA: DNA polymerase III subunit gamma/tau [Actinomycetota bacterium]|jgi:DNA polymerase-3 subunit gamma/tau|nr:DNA polymerase III subunit gamma/tau [Actinomycetota bacterium]